MVNTLEGLRVNQWGVEGVKATSTLTITLIPTAGKTIIIGGRTYTFRAAGDTDATGEISIGISVGEARTNLVAAIAGNALNIVNARVSMAAFSGATSVVTALHPGPAGNSLAFTGTYTDDAGNSATAFTLGAFARGTAVAATSQIALENLEWSDDDDANYQPMLRNGLLMRNRGEPVAVKRGSRFSFSDQSVIYEQIPHWLSLLVTGDVIPTIEAGPVYRWTLSLIHI